MNIPAILSAGAISLGLLTFTGEEASASAVSATSVTSVSAPSVVVSVSVSAIDELDGILSSAQSPSALKEAEKKVAEEVKEAEKLAKKDAKVCYVMFHIICFDWLIELMDGFVFEFAYLYKDVRTYTHHITPHYTIHTFHTYIYEYI